MSLWVVETTILLARSPTAISLQTARQESLLKVYIAIGFIFPDLSFAARIAAKPDGIPDSFGRLSRFFDEPNLRKLKEKLGGFTLAEVILETDD